jgi:hypothetical protein
MIEHVEHVPCPRCLMLLLGTGTDTGVCPCCTMYSPKNFCYRRSQYDQWYGHDLPIREVVITSLVTLVFSSSRRNDQYRRWYGHVLPICLLVKAPGLFVKFLLFAAWSTSRYGWGYGHVYPYGSSLNSKELFFVSSIAKQGQYEHAYGGISPYWRLWKCLGTSKQLIPSEFI